MIQDTLLNELLADIGLPLLLMGGIYAFIWLINPDRESRPWGRLRRIIKK